jgi:hypothetical protein
MVTEKNNNKKNVFPWGMTVLIYSFSVFYSVVSVSPW